MPRRLILTLATLPILCVFNIPGTAQAGFQWVAPAAPQVSAGEVLQPPSSMSGMSDSSAPSIPLPLVPATDSSDNTSPLVIQGSQSTEIPAQALPQSGNEESAAYGGTVSTLRPMAAANAAPRKPEAIVHGFAKSVPLAVALRQILPPGYSYSIDQGVDMGTTVSFEGGHGWHETLRAALVPVGLSMREHGNIVSVGYVTDASTSSENQLPSVMVNTAALTRVSASASRPAATSGQWVAEHGDSLHKVLDEWCRRARVDLNWMAEYDYPVQATASFNGSFEEAVRGLLMGFEGAHPQPVAELHSNPHVGQLVLVVQTRGNSNSD